jgi:hypothetical protein
MAGTTIPAAAATAILPIAPRRLIELMCEARMSKSP